MVNFKTHDLRKNKNKEEKVEIESQEVEIPIPEPVSPEAIESVPEPVEAEKPVSAPTPTPTRRKPERRTPARKTAKKELPPAKTESKPAPKPTPPPPKPTFPIIGITCGFEHLPHKELYSQQYFYLYRTYVTAIHEAGGIPVMIPVGLEKKYSHNVIEVLDGLLLPGSNPDVDPNQYGDLAKDELGPVQPRQDRTEIELFNLAFAKNIPILGICRGIQVMNVALDGTLYQDISTQVRMSINHNPKFPQNETSHWVDIADSSKLHKILGEKQVWVNSLHHQAVKLNGKGLNVSAKAPDGLTEGLEHPTKKFVIGVQWHPELLWMKDKANARLFTEFIAACKS